MFVPLDDSAFSARFGETLACAPIGYLARWQMALAKDTLARGARTLDRIAQQIGYEAPRSADGRGALPESLRATSRLKLKDRAFESHAGSRRLRIE